MIKKEIIYEPLLEAKKQLLEFMENNPEKVSEENKEKLILLNECIAIFEKEDY